MSNVNKIFLNKLIEMIREIIAFLEGTSSDSSALFLWDSESEKTRRRLFWKHFSDLPEIEKESTYLRFNFEVDSFIFDENMRILPFRGMGDRALELCKNSLERAKETLRKLEELQNVTDAVNPAASNQ